jgi:hypothetical protein
MGFTAINAQGLTAPPFFASFLCTIATTWVADRLQQRGLMIAALSAIGGVGYVLCATCESVGVRYFGVFLAACGVFPSIANILPWVLSELFRLFLAIILGINFVQSYILCTNLDLRSRQPRLRYPPWWRYHPPKPHRPVWSLPGNQHIPR